MPMLSLSPLTTLPCSPLDQIEAAYVAGFDAVGLRLQPTLPTDIDVLGDAALRRAIERKLASTQLRLMDVDVIRVGSRTDVAALEPLLAFAGGLGAKNLVFTSLTTDEYLESGEHATALKIAEVCVAAGRHGVRPIVEFIPFRGISSLAHSLRIASLVDHPNFAICVDVLHLCRSGGSPADLAAADPRLLACLQLCDAPMQAPSDLPKESRYDRLYPGDGEFPLRELLQSVPVELDISVEVPNARAQATLSPIERAKKAATTARALLASARRSSPA
jgi:sugar phosphate isomerase/epimerase